jgi:hypothetical protein
VLSRAPRWSAGARVNLGRIYARRYSAVISLQCWQAPTTDGDHRSPVSFTCGTLPQIGVVPPGWTACHGVTPTVITLSPVGVFWTGQGAAVAR